MNQKAKSVDSVLADIERQELHPTRQLARGLIVEYRKGTAIDLEYDFSKQPVQLRQIVYNQIVRFHCRRRWRLFR